jgi:hypothetical protein
MDIFTAKDALKRATEIRNKSFQANLKDVYEEINSGVEQGFFKITIFKTIPADVKEFLNERGFIIAEYKSGMNELDTIISWEAK